LAAINAAIACETRLFDFLRALDLAPYEWQHVLDWAKGNDRISVTLSTR
jgi:hypothetical protein